jgi:hypothetical protein
MHELLEGEKVQHARELPKKDGDRGENEWER